MGCEEIVEFREGYRDRKVRRRALLGHPQAIAYEIIKFRGKNDLKTIMNFNIQGGMPLENNYGNELFKKYFKFRGFYLTAGVI